MRKEKPSTNELIACLVIIAPFLLGVVFSLIGLFSLVDNSIQPPFDFNLPTVLIIGGLHLLTIIAFTNWKKVPLGDILNPKKKILGMIFLTFFILISSFIFTISLEMDLNFWLKSDASYKIVITVKEKRISRGRSTDHYIDFETPNGSMSHRISRREYDKFKVGETFSVDVYKGYFEGYFLTHKLK